MYAVDMTTSALRDGTMEEIRAAIEAAGLNPDLPPANISGPSATYYGGTRRSHLCEVGGLEIDGHDIQPGTTTCTFCDHDEDL